MRRLRSPIIVGRVDELAILRDAVGKASTGSGGCLFVLGEAGSGKTRLLEDANEAAASAGLSVLRAVAPSALTAPPFGVLGAAFRSYFRHATPPRAVELHPFTAGLRQVLPEWPGAHEMQQLSEDQLNGLALEGCLRLLLGLARDRGVLLVLDDLHAADAQTLAFVHHAAPALTASRVLLVGAVRTGQAGPGRPEVTALQRRGVATVVALRPLDPPSVGALTEAILGVPPTPQLCAYIAARSDGVPLFVEQLLEANLAAGALIVQGRRMSWDEEQAASVPHTTAELVSEQLARLPASARGLVRAAAIAGPAADSKLLGRMCQVSEDGLVTAVEAALDAGLFEETEGGFALRHPLIRDAVVATIVEPERTRLHRRAAEAVLANRSDDPRSLEVAGEHLQLAGDSGGAARLFVSVGEQRLGQAAAIAAEAAARRALALADDRDTRERASDVLARALTLVGRWEEAIACDSVPGRSDDPTRLMRMARNAVRAGRRDQAQALLERARAAGGDAALLAVVSALLAIERGDAEIALALGSEALSLVQGDTRGEVACEALYLIGRAHDIAGRRGDLSEAVRVGEELVSLCREHRLDLLPHALLAAAAARDSVVAGDGDDLIAEALAAGEDRNVLILAESLRGWSALRAGNLEAAIRHLADAAAAVRVAPAAAVPADGPFLWVCALMAAGRQEEARAALQEAHALPAAHRVHINAMLLALGTALVQGQPDAVQPALEPARKGANYYRAVCLLLAADVLRPADAATWAREALDIFTVSGADTDVARARRLLREVGAPVPRARRVGQDLPEPLQRRGVTAREGEILRLIGNGLSNAEIADRLFLSVRTVEGNVSRLLTKIDVPNRAGLIATAQSLFGQR